MYLLRILSNVTLFKKQLFQRMQFNGHFCDEFLQTIASIIYLSANKRVIKIESQLWKFQNVLLRKIYK